MKHEIIKRKKNIVLEINKRYRDRIEKFKPVRKIERLCFWTWPFGHIWKYIGECKYQCINCKKIYDQTK